MISFHGRRKLKWYKSKLGNTCGPFLDEILIRLMGNDDGILYCRELKENRMNVVLQKSAKEILIEKFMEYLSVIKIKSVDIETMCRNLVNVAKVVIANVYCQSLENQDKVFEEISGKKVITRTSLIREDINFLVNTEEELEIFEVHLNFQFECF